MKKAYIKEVQIKQWFDKINWNTYFNYILIDTKNNIIYSDSKMIYWYNANTLNNFKGYIDSRIRKEKINFTKNCRLIDFWYWLKKELEFLKF